MANVYFIEKGNQSIWVQTVRALRDISIFKENAKKSNTTLKRIKKAKKATFSESRSRYKNNVSIEQ